jgi:hypothetical protein
MESATRGVLVRPVTIGDRTIGAGLPAFVVAEMSGNHNGDVGRAVRIRHAAADAGADAPGPASLCLDISMRAGAALADPEFAPWNVECLDLARATRELGRTRFPGRVFYSSLDEIAPSRRYDIVVSFEALEHAFAPVTLVSRVHALLAGGGVFCGLLSNVESLLVRVMGAEAPLFDGIYQKYFFHTGSLGRLLSGTGFADIRFQTAVPCTERIVETLGRLVGDGHELPSRAAIETLARTAEVTPLGYKLLFVARKATAAGAPSSPTECRRYSSSRR